MGVIFGVSLEELLLREKRHPAHGGSGIPLLVEFVVNYLRANALKNEGLLRITGNFQRVEKLRKIFDNASLKSFDSISLEKYTVHDVAALLRMYLRELPNPVIPYSFYEPLMEIQRDANLPIVERVNAIQQVVAKIPISNTPLLQYLIRFLQDVEEFSHINKMTVSNLAIVFGPNIVRPEVETVENALEMPLLQGIIQILLEHTDVIWKGTAFTKRQSVRMDRPFSVLFVGKDLTPTLQKDSSAHSSSAMCDGPASVRNLLRKMELQNNAREEERKRQQEQVKKEELAQIKEGTVAMKKRLSLLPEVRTPERLERSASSEIPTAMSLVLSPRAKKEKKKRRMKDINPTNGTATL